MVARRARDAKARLVTSLTNPLMRAFRQALVEGTSRDGLLAIEGPHLLEDALAAQHSIRVHSVLLGDNIFQKAGNLIARLPEEAEVARVPDRLFQRISQTKTPQAVAALVELPNYELPQLLSGPEAVLVAACGVQDPGNLGTILRSAQALGASACLTLKHTVSPYNPKVVRSSAGAIFRLPIFTGLTERELLSALRAARVRVVMADRRSPLSVTSVDLRGRLAVLIGSEAAGVSTELARQADLRLSIPIRPETDSINAAVAASIFLYEIARQRGFSYQTAAGLAGY